MFGWLSRATSLRLSPEPAQRGVVPELPSDHDLDRHLPRQPQVVRRVDRAHSSPADETVQAVLAVDRAGDRQGEGQGSPVAFARSAPPS